MEAKDVESVASRHARPTQGPMTGQPRAREGDELTYHEGAVEAVTVSVKWVVRWKYQNLIEGVSVVEAPSAEAALVKAISERAGTEPDDVLSLGAKFTVYRVGRWT